MTYSTISLLSLWFELNRFINQLLADSLRAKRLMPSLPQLKIFTPGAYSLLSCRLGRWSLGEEKALQPVVLAARASLQDERGIRADLLNTIQK
jgi:hypothetical protein